MGAKIIIHKPRTIHICNKWSKEIKHVYITLKIITRLIERKTISKDTYPISPPRQAESLWFVNYKPHDTWKLEI